MVSATGKMQIATRTVFQTKTKPAMGATHVFLQSTLTEIGFQTSSTSIVTMTALPTPRKRSLAPTRSSPTRTADGVTDLIEVAAETDAFDKNDSPRTRGDFVFTIPFEEEAEPRKDTLNFRTNIQFADMYILFDQTTSMNEELQSLRDALTSAVVELTCDDFQVSCLGDSTCDQGQICGAAGTCIESPRVTSCIEKFLHRLRHVRGFPYALRFSSADPSTTVASLLSSATQGGKEQHLRLLHV